MSLSPWMGSFGKLQIGQWSSSLDHWTTLQGCTLKCCQLSTILLVGWQVGCACCCLTALAGSEQYLSKSICQAGVWFWNCLGWGYRKSLCDSLGAKLLNCSPERVTTLNQSLYFKCQEQGPSWKINRSTGRVFSVLHPSSLSSLLALTARLLWAEQKRHRLPSVLSVLWVAIHLLFPSSPAMRSGWVCVGMSSPRWRRALSWKGAPVGRARSASLGLLGETKCTKILTEGRLFFLP